MNQRKRVLPLRTIGCLVGPARQAGHGEEVPLGKRDLPTFRLNSFIVIPFKLLSTLGPARVPF
jgi:hypothetical protein